jgi:hypothetical protein
MNKTAKWKRPPMQPIAKDDDGVARFRANDVVRWLIDVKGISLNEVAIAAQNGNFDRYDVAQFWQMLGYSVSGYGDLSFIPKSIVRKADEKADKLRSKRTVGK